MTTLGFDIFARDKGATTAFQKIAKGADATNAAMAKVAKANDAVAASSEKLAKAQAAEADALGKVRVATAKLEETRKKGSATQLAVAEERLATAQRRASLASEAARTASKKYSDSQAAAGRASKDLAAAQSQVVAKSRQQSSALEKTGASAGVADKKFAVLTTRVRGLSAGLGKFAIGIGAFATGTTAALAGVAASGAVVGIKTAASLEQAQIGFETLLGSGKKAEAFLGDLQKFAAATPFELPGLIDSSRMLIGVGLSAKQVVPLLRAFGDAAGAVGVGQEAFQRIMLATSQAISAGKFQTEDLNQIMENGIPIWTILSKATGKPVPELRKLASAGKLLAKDVLPVLQGQMEKDYGGAMARQSQTLSGMWSTLMDTLNIGLANVIKPLMPALKDGLAGAIGIAGKAFSGFGTVMNGTVIPAAMGLYNLLVKHDFSKQFKQAFHVEEDSGIVSFLLKINEGVTDAAANAKKWAGAIIDGLTAGFKTGNWKPLGKTLGDGVVAGLKAIGTGGGKLLDAISGLVDEVDWPKLGAKISTGIRGFIAGIDWKSLGSAVGDGIINLFQKATDLGEKVGRAFKDLMQRVDWKQIGRDSTDAIGRFIEGVDWVKLGKTLGIAAFKSLKLDKQIYDQIIGSAVDLVIGMAQAIGKAIGKWFSGAGNWLKQKGEDLVGGLKSGASDQASGIGAWLAARIVQPVVGAFKDSGKWLVSHGRNLIVGLKNGIASAASAIGAWIMRAPVAQVVAPFLGAVKWLIGPGKNVIAGLLTGIGNAAKGIGNWLGRNVISPVVAAFGKAGSWLVQQGRNLIAGFLNGVSGIARGIGRWISTNVISPIVIPFSRAGLWLVNQGKNLVAGLKNGVVSVASSIGRFMYDRVAVPAVSAFGQAGSWLARAGRDLIGGLTGGVAARMKGISSWIKTTIINPIVSGVKTFFGIKSPSTVFAGIGGNLIAGLFKGMGSGVGTAIAKKVFGDMPSALRSIVGKGLISVSNLPKKALDALGSSIGIGAPIGGPSGNTSNEGIVRTLAGQYGWGSGAQWNSLRALIMGESGFNNNAQNPTSSAYGLFQFLDSTWGSVGASKTSDPWAQTIAGLKYIARSYGSPANAYAKWSSRSPHWYGDGGLITETVLGIGLKSGKKYGFGERGTEVVTPMHKIPRAVGGQTQVVLRIESGGSKMDELIAEILRRYVRVNGGNVQTVLGRG